MYNFKELSEKLTGKCKNSRKLDNNTYLIRDGKNLAIKLHDTNVVTYTPDGKIILNSGGWQTPTTKDRMEKFSPAHISQNNFVWYINGSVYQDGCYYKDGKWHKMAGMRQTKALVKRLNQIKKYSTDYINALIKGKIPAPSGGDCWFCCLRDKDGKTMGDHGGKDHFISHFQQKYYVPSLLMNALDFYPASIAANQYLQILWTEGRDSARIYEWIAKTQFRRSIQQYLKHQFGIAR